MGKTSIREVYPCLSAVMPGLVPGIHAFQGSQTWMAGTSPAMTPEKTSIG